MSGSNRIADVLSAKPDRSIQLAIQGKEHKFLLDQVTEFGARFPDGFSVGFGPDGLTLSIGEYDCVYSWTEAIALLTGNSNASS